MENKTNPFLKYFFSLIRKKILLFTVINLAVIALVVSLYQLNKDSFITISQNKKIYIIKFLFSLPKLFLKFNYNIRN